MRISIYRRLDGVHKIVDTGKYTYTLLCVRTRKSAMARVSIYVTDDLKARMDGVGESVNWSEIVRPAIQAAIATQEHRRGQNMSTAIERLRASKQESAHRDEMEGREHGREWAETHASYDDLRRLAKIIFAPNDYRGAFSALSAAINPLDEMTAAEVKEYCFGNENEDITDEYVGAWIEGVQEFFEEVRDKL
jgi:hypothetical protein